MGCGKSAVGILVAERTGAENVLVLANETVVGEPLLARIREKSRASSRSSFLIVCPQSDPEQGEHPDRGQPGERSS